MESNYFFKTPHWKLISILLACGYFFLMFGNGIVSLTHPDEVFYTQTAKEMVAHKSWLTPLIFDAPQFEKPILFYWLLALAVKWFGASPFVARFWPAFFGILGALVTYWITFMLFERKRTSFWASLILMSSFIYLALSRAVLTDMVFSIWVVISLGFFYWGYRYREHKKEGIILSLIFSAIAVLTKGVLGITFPWLIIFLFLWYKKDFIFLKDKAAIIGILLFLAIALPWHILMYSRYGQFFLDEYFKNVHIRRIFEAEHARCDTWFFYPLTMAMGMFPWSFFIFPAIVGACQHYRRRTIQRDPNVFLFIWILGIFICVQPAHSKLASYIFPVFPAMAILLAFYLDQSLEKISQGIKIKTIQVWGYCLPFIFIGLAAASLVASGIYTDYAVNKTPVYIFCFLMILLTVMILIFIRGKKYTALTFAPMGVTVSLLITLFFAKGYIEPWVSCQGIIQEFKKIDSSKGIVLSSKFYARAVRYYTDREVAVMDINGKGFFSPHPIPFLNADHLLLGFLKGHSPIYGIVKKGDVKDLERLREMDPFYTLEVLKEIGGKYIVRIKKIY